MPYMSATSARGQRNEHHDVYVDARCREESFRQAGASLDSLVAPSSCRGAENLEHHGYNDLLT